MAAMDIDDLELDTTDRRLLAAIIQNLFATCWWWC